MKAAGVLERSLHPGIQSSNISDSNTYLIMLSETRVFWCQFPGPTLPSRFFKLDAKRQRWAKLRRIASSLSISSTAINCFLTDASTKRGRSDLYFKSAAAASPQAGEEESSFLSCLRAFSVNRSDSGLKQVGGDLVFCNSVFWNSVFGARRWYIACMQVCVTPKPWSGRKGDTGEKC